MSGDYIKLAEAPALCYQSPTCSACSVDLLSEDGWLCPVCGTAWSYDASDGDRGDLYELWSGETLDAEPLDEDAAMNAGMAFEREARRALRERLGLKP